MKWSRVLSVPAAALAGLAAYDMTQKHHAILRNYPVIGHARYLLESIGPELRQYIVADNDEERPFSRDQRTWVYSSAKLENNYFGFGTDNDVEFTDGYPVIKHRTFAEVTPPSLGEEAVLPSAKVVGAARGRAGSFRPQSVVNISGMSFGSLSAPAVEALNRGSALAGCLHNTGEGSITPYHRHGGDLIWQIGTGYFGCRDDRGRFDLAQVRDMVARAPVKAIEIKLSQGAKPGLGGVLPAAKMTEELAQIRGVPVDEDCVSPSRHSEFTDVDSMLDWVEMIADATGLPVGIKSAVGVDHFWEDLARQMAETDRGVDFITVDGGEGGTGAAPLTFTDAVGLPFRLGFTKVLRRFEEAGIADDVTFIGSGKLGAPTNAVVGFALGCDMVNVGREAMLAVGCIQAKICQTGKCPTGVATQNPRLVRGLDVPSKAERTANYIRTLRRDLMKVSQACGVMHPGMLSTDDIDIADGHRSSTPLREMYDYQEGWGVPSKADQEEITRILRDAAR